MKLLLISMGVSLFSFASPALAVPEWREPFIEAVVMCQEPLLLKQYSNMDYTFTLFVDPSQGLVACIYDNSHSIVKLGGEKVKIFEDGYLTFFQAGEPDNRYRLMLELPESFEVADEGWEHKYFFELTQDGVVKYRRAVQLNPVFLK